MTVQDGGVVRRGLAAGRTVMALRCDSRWLAAHEENAAQFTAPCVWVCWTGVGLSTSNAALWGC